MQSNVLKVLLADLPTGFLWSEEDVRRSLGDDAVRVVEVLLRGEATAEEIRVELGFSLSETQKALERLDRWKGSTRLGWRKTGQTVTYRFRPADKQPSRG